MLRNMSFLFMQHSRTRLPSCTKNPQHKPSKQIDNTCMKQRYKLVGNIS